MNRSDDWIWQHAGGREPDVAGRPRYTVPVISAARLRSIAAALLPPQIRSMPPAAADDHDAGAASPRAGRRSA